MPTNLLQESFGISKSLLASTNISASDVKSGIKFMNPNGEVQTGTLALSGNATVSDVMSGKTFYSNSFTKQTGIRTIYSNGSVFLSKPFVKNPPTSFTVNNVHALVLEFWRMGGYPSQFKISCTAGSLSETNQDNRRYVMISNIPGSTTINITNPYSEYWLVGFGFRMT